MSTATDEISAGFSMHGRSPMYATVARSIASDITSGRYPVGSIIPSELLLTQRYGVSRHTVRQALAELKQQGMLSSHPGIGTTVRARPQTPKFVSGLSAISELLQLVGSTWTRILSSKEVIADETLCALLQCEPQQVWLEMQCVRESKDAQKPIGHVVVFIRAEHASALRGMTRLETPFYALLEKEFGLSLAEVRQEIEASNLDCATADILGCRPDEAALRIVRHFFDKDGRIIEVSVSHHPRGRYKQVSRFRATTAPAGDQ